MSRGEERWVQNANFRTYKSAHRYPFIVGLPTRGTLDFEGVVEGVLFRVCWTEVGDPRRKDSSAVAQA